MNANHCCAKGNRNKNRFLPIEPDSAVLLSLATHTHTLVHMHRIAFVVDGWRMGANATRSEGLNRLGEGARGEGPVGPLGAGTFFRSSLC